MSKDLKDLITMAQLSERLFAVETKVFVLLSTLLRVSTEYGVRQVAGIADLYDSAKKTSLKLSDSKGRPFAGRRLSLKLPPSSLCMKKREKNTILQSKQG